ncbi:uncharacterized protein LOC131882567 [Tigriopus californicus]|uniref:uncharacterized protein LOC131882567 n=1 Tax=Tigriopus californicus TaxID=6832 RepID=UPI0027DA8468|nr:uncharacterized protein LOC131882567 [Tigriopus californicus]
MVIEHHLVFTLNSFLCRTPNVDVRRICHVRPLRMFVIDGLKFVQIPVTLEEAATVEPFTCDSFPKLFHCLATSCRYAEDSLLATMHGSGKKYMTVCHECPKKYPSLGNPQGPEDEEYMNSTDVYQYEIHV